MRRQAEGLAMHHGDTFRLQELADEIVELRKERVALRDIVKSALDTSRPAILLRTNPAVRSSVPPSGRATTVMPAAEAKACRRSIRCSWGRAATG